MKKLEWTIRISIGFFCYYMVLAWPQPWNQENKLFIWVLGMAGFYAYDNGFKNWLGRGVE